MKIYFFCHPQGDRRTPAFQHQLINLAFGLRELGIEFFANINYWKTSQSEYLFNAGKIPPQECDLLITSHGEYEYNWPLDQAFLTNKRTYKTIYIDTSDGLFNRSYENEMRAFDLILKQKTSNMWYPKNCQSSWAFGLLPYMTRDSTYTQKNLREILINYRHLHTFRKAGDKIISALESFRINRNTDALDYSSKYNSIEKEDDFYTLGHLQSGGRFHHSYLDRMAKSSICACFGGNLLPNSFFTKNKKIFRFSNYLYDNTNQGRLVNILRKLKISIKHTYGIYQWDSWRLWEAFANGTTVLTIDFEKYGILLPEMTVG